MVTCRLGYVWSNIGLDLLLRALYLKIEIFIFVTRPPFNKGRYRHMSEPMPTFSTYGQILVHIRALYKTQVDIYLQLCHH